MKHKLALLGGTFDPVHIGHLCMAEWVLQSLGLERVLFVPAAVPPHKFHLITPAAHRLEMLRLALAGNPVFELSTVELERSGPSYTLHTLQHFAAASPQTQLWWVIGLDSLLNLHSWYGYEQFPAYARLAVIPRPNQQLAQRAEIEEHIRTRLPAFVSAIDWIDMPRLEIASSAIRTWLGQGLSCRYLLPAAVWDYLQAQELYRPKSGL